MAFRRNPRMWTPVWPRLLRHHHWTSSKPEAAAWGIKTPRASSHLAFRHSNVLATATL